MQCICESVALSVVLKWQAHPSFFLSDLPFSKLRLGSTIFSEPYPINAHAPNLVPWHLTWSFNLDYLTDLNERSSCWSQVRGRFSQALTRRKKVLLHIHIQKWCMSLKLLQLSWAVLSPGWREGAPYLQNNAGVSCFTPTQAMKWIYPYKETGNSCLLRFVTRATKLELAISMCRLLARRLRLFHMEMGNFKTVTCRKRKAEGNGCPWTYTKSLHPVSQTTYSVVSALLKFTLRTVIKWILWQNILQNG